MLLHTLILYTYLL